MKRREMLYAMVQAAYNKHNGELMEFPYFADKLAETMLFACECAGMLPPARIGALVGLDGIPVHAWEPEDEVVPSLPFGVANVGFIENLHTGSEFTPESIGLPLGFFDKMHIFRCTCKSALICTCE